MSAGRLNVMVIGVAPFLDGPCSFQDITLLYDANIHRQAPPKQGPAAMQCHPACLPLKLSTARIMAMMFSTGVRA
jgi:hypothetical protein